MAKAHLPLAKLRGLSPALRDLPRVRFTLALMATAGVKQVMIATGPESIAELHARFGDGKGIGVALSYQLLAPDSCIETALMGAHRYFAGSAVILATPGVCCINFNLACLGLSSGSLIASFTMRNGVSESNATRPDLLFLGHGVLNRLKRETGKSATGSFEVDPFRRALMSRYKYLNVDLSHQCVFANLKEDVSINPSELSEGDMMELVDLQSTERD